MANCEINYLLIDLPIGGGGGGGGGGGVTEDLFLNGNILMFM
jgi:hypothetical protein